ncbi:MAG TPA: MFS transporter [Steroidobacteraceae bacterium]|nr:MFS transporter [Steroidobacteraceae bacterium]
MLRTSRAAAGIRYNPGGTLVFETPSQLNPDNRASASPKPAHRAFSSFSNGDFRIYFLSATAAIMADNVEHVISYWVIFQKFHSPALAGFAVISHWVPFLFFAAFSGALADRFDVRRLIQIGTLMLFSVSIGWGAMFLTDSVALWKAMALLVVHGLAGVFWLPAAQVLIHQIVSAEQLPSAVRLMATSRYLGFLVGPAVGGGLLLLLGPSYGIVVNALIYLPLVLWLIEAPYGRAAADWRPVPPALHGFADIWSTMKVVARHPTLLSMTVLVGASSFFVGNAYQAQMPGFAQDLGHGRVDVSYSALLAADAAGGLAGGLLLESRAMLAPRARTAFILAMIWCAALIGFARSNIYVLAISLLFIAGFVELAFNSMAQALVQMNAPSEIRGRVIGVFSMSAMGMRTFSGLSVGILGASVGIHNSLGLSAAALFVIIAVMFAGRYRRGRGKEGP